MQFIVIESIQSLIHNDPAFPAGMRGTVNAKKLVSGIFFEIYQWKMKIGGNFSSLE